MRQRRNLVILLGIASFLMIPGGARAVAVPLQLSRAARETAPEIRREALLPPNGPAGRPLPLLSHWNGGSHGKGWIPQYQVALLQQGHRLLPWMHWPDGLKEGDADSERRFKEYFGELLAFCRELRLPISFCGTQWEAILLKEPYCSRPAEENPDAITPEGEVLRRLSPFGPLEPWRDPAKVYVATPAMRRVQAIYPDPPLVLLISNNEAPRLRWNKVEEHSRRYLEKYGKGRSNEFKREVVARGWMERYPVMFGAMRDALVSPYWRKNVRFVGYGAFGPSHFGRWGGWKRYSLITDEWTSPNWHIWDGGTPSYYTHDWCPNRDHWVWSTQIESMNWIFQLEEAWKANPDFWWEVSLWDGNSKWHPGMRYSEELLKESKACQYAKDGQTYTPNRFEGWAQFGLWLLRPRVLREFRNNMAPLRPWQPYFERLIKIVDRVHENPTLAEFWRHGRLVPNPDGKHPYQESIPEKYRDVPRWFLLSTNLDPPRPWKLKTNVPVFSIALELGEPGSRRWLVYAHSPLEDRRDVEITVPECGGITVDVPREGAFCVVDEGAERQPKCRRLTTE